ncbi:MAG TPA: anhydro-N-acetylmuramic acid kinase, partial [Terriglobales bacterium]|nr:anhydro-N-acetylmuramic acid kinase [Terriglobales bacterium]
DLVGCHGQTIYHQGESRPFLGRKIRCTWQTGEGAVIAARLGVPVVSDFRPADMAAGGKGAPLVPFLDYALFRHRRTGRILQNLGGIANLTAIPAGSLPKDVIAFDTGPGNMLIDQLMQKLFSRPFDRNGETARKGKELQPVLEGLLKGAFFDRQPPKTAGREEFGREFAQEFLRRCGRAAKADVIATATALTAQSIAWSIRKFVLPSGNYGEYIVSGGGTKNRTLMRMLAVEASQLGLKIRHSDELGVPSAAKEAAAFALLAHQTWLRQPGNIPSATGAARPAVLGKVSYA